MFDRNLAIEELIACDMNTIGNYPDYLDSILRYGHKGYNEYTDEELMEALEDRDISYLFGENDD